MSLLIIASQADIEGMIIHKFLSDAENKGAKIKTAFNQQVLDWVVKAWETMKEKSELIAKSFQVTGITSTDLELCSNSQPSRARG